MSRPGPPLYRCSNCGCPMLDHAVDDEERRECSLCECIQYEHGLGEPFCACGRRSSDCDGSRRGCVAPRRGSDEAEGGS
jgi:hypothetical protein